MTGKDKAQRPDGCPFDAYGHRNKEFLESLTCGNCPLTSMNCEFKGYANLENLSEGLRKGQGIQVVSRC